MFWHEKTIFYVSSSSNINIKLFFSGKEKLWYISNKLFILLPWHLRDALYSQLIETDQASKHVLQLVLCPSKRSLFRDFSLFQFGRQETVRWLVEKTRDRERLASRDGERCLLHTAARYGQVRAIKVALCSDIGYKHDTAHRMSGTWGPVSSHSGKFALSSDMKHVGSCGAEHVLDNDCQLLYKYFHIFSAVKQNNEQMRKSQSLTSWDEFPLCTLLEISHHASLQAAQTWKYFNSNQENISIKIGRQWMCDWLLNVWKVLQMFWHHVTYTV